MKGAVFVTLKTMIEESHGPTAWAALVDKVAPECEGVYDANENYPDADAIAYIGAVAELLNSSASAVTEIFGRYLFDALNSMSPQYAAASPTLFGFLQSIEPLIHREIRNSNKSSSLPVIVVRVTDEQHLLMRYNSPRKLCFLAEGLIRGAAKHYGETVEISHDKCLHRGDICCELNVIKPAT